MTNMAMKLHFDVTDKLNTESVLVKSMHRIGSVNCKLLYLTASITILT
jgi:hypothetical protein